MSGASIWSPGDTVDFSSVTADNTIKSERLALATRGQQLCAITTFTYAVATGTLMVFLNGVKQTLGIDYVETDGSHITFTAGLEDNDVIDVVGFIGTSGAIAAALSAAQAAASALSAQQYYTLILGLSLPSLPLSVANGGTGTNTAAGARTNLGFPGLQSGTVFGSLDGATISNISLPLSVSMSNAGDTIPITNQLNWSYVLNANTNLVLNAVAKAIKSILKIIAIGSGSFTVATAGGVQTTFSSGQDYVLSDNTLAQGIWTPSIAYGKKTQLSGVKYCASYAIDANRIVIVTQDNNGNNVYVTIYNTSTKTFGNTVTIGSVSNASSSDTILANIFSNGAAGYFVLSLSPQLSSVTSGVTFVSFSTSGNTLTSGTALKTATLGAMTSWGVGNLVKQLTATTYLVATAIGGSATHTFSIVTVTNNSIATPTVGTQQTTGTMTFPSSVIHSIDAIEVLAGGGGFVVSGRDGGGGSGACAYAVTITAGTLAFPAAAASTLSGSVSYTNTGTMLYAHPTSGGFVQVLSRVGSSARCQLLTVSGTVLSQPVAFATLATADTLGTVISTADCVAYYRTDVYKVKALCGYWSGNTLVLLAPNGTGSGAYAYSWSAGVFTGATTITVGTSIGGSGTAAAIIKSSAGNVWYTDNNLNTIKPLVVTGTNLSLGATALYSTYIPATTFVNENLMNGNYYTVAGGVATLLGAYPLIDTAIASVLLTNGTYVTTTGGLVDGVM